MCVCVPVVPLASSRSFTRRILTSGQLGSSHCKALYESMPAKMSGSPTSRGEESVSLPCSLPSTPIFPPLTEVLSQVAAKSREEGKQLENRTRQVQDHAELEAQAEGNISTAIADGQQHQQGEQPQAKKHRLVPPKASESNAKGYNNDKPHQRRAQTLAFVPSGMPSSLLRPLDHEDEKKLLQLEQQFRKERMETLRRQNVSRRRRHAEKLQHLRAAAVREQAAALEDRHQKLQAARILMERGLAAAAASASAATNQFDTTSNTATHAPDHSSALSTTGMASALVATTAPAVRCQRREMPFNAAAPAAGDLGPVATSDSLPICQATRHLAPSPVESKTNAQQRSAHQHYARGHVYTSSSEHFPSCWRRDVNFSHATISIPRNSVDGNIVTHATDAGYRGFPDVSTVGECVVAGAALRYKGALSSDGNYEAAGSCGYHCQAAQEILSLWPCGRRTLLNAAVDNGEGVVLLQNQKINRLVLAASVSSHQRTEQASCDPYSSAAPSCESTCLRRVNTECGSHSSHPALSTSKTHPAPRMRGNSRRLTISPSALLRNPACSPPESSGQAQADQKQSLGSHVTTRETECEQHRKQQQQQPKHLQRDQQRDAFRQQCQTTDDSPSRQQGRGLDLPQPHPPALKQQHQPNQSQAARAGCLTEYSDVDDGKIYSFFKHARQAAQSQILQVHSWYPQRSSPPTVLGVPLSVSPETRHDKHAHQRQNTEGQPINSPDVRDCSPCESTASSATTGAAKPIIREQCPLAVQEQQVQVEQAPQQQSEGVDYQNNQRKNRSQLPRPGAVTRSSATARKNSYAGQFAVVSRAKVGEAQQRRRKSNQEAHKLDCDLSQRQPAATASTEALDSASPLGSVAAGASTFSFTSSSSTDKLLVPAALSDAATVPTACRTHVALRPVVPVKVPSVFAERCFNNAAEALQAHVPWGHSTVHKSRHNSTSRPVGLAVTTRAASSRRTSPWQQFQQGQQQQRYSHQLKQSAAHTTEEQPPERDKGSNHICTGVQVVNRKLKALIEQQLQYAKPCASNVVAARDPVLRVAAAAGDVDSNSQDADINEEAGNIILKETHVEAADLASASLAANEMRASHSSRADGESMPLPQRISSPSNTVFSQSLSVDSESARQQLQHPKQSFGDHQSGQETTLPATEQFQVQAVTSQHQQPQSKSTEECVDCVRAVHGTEGMEHSDTIGGSKYFELQGDDLPGGTVCEPVADSFHRSDSEAEGGLVLSVNERISCGQCVGKSLCTIEEQREYMRPPVQLDGTVHPAEKTETDLRQYDARQASAMLPEGEDSPSTRTEPDVHSAQPPREYTSKKPDSHKGMQSEEERTETIPSSVYDDTCPRIIRVCATSALEGTNAPRKDKHTSSPCRHSEPFKNIHVRRRRLPQERGIACDLSAGLAGPTGCLESSDSEDETEKEETGEERAMEEHAQSPENTCDATQEAKLCVLPGKGISILRKRIAERECTRGSSTLFARSSVRLSSCSASCNSPTCRRISTARDDTAATLTDKHCAVGSSVRSGRPARGGASQTTQPSVAVECGNRGQTGCAAVGHDHFSVRCSLRNGPPHRAAGDSGRKCVEACSGKGRSSCGAAHNVTSVRRQRGAPCSSQVRPEQQQEQRKHEGTASGFSAHSVKREQSELHVPRTSQSPVYSLQEKQTADASSSPPSGHQQLCSECRYMNYAPEQPHQFGPGAEMREVNDQRRLAANPVSPTFRCSCCSGAGPQGQHRQEQPQYGNGNTAEEHGASQAKQRVTSCTKQASPRRAKVPLTSCISGHRCKTRSGNPTPCYSGSRHRTLATQNRNNRVNSDIPDARIDPHRTSSRSSSGGRSSGNSSSRGRENMQRLDRCATTSGRQEGLNITLSTAKKETYGGCGSPAPCMHVVSRSCNRPLRTVTSTSASLGNRESRRAVRCRSNQEPCSGAPEASRSNTCVSTCCGSAGDSVDSSTLCCIMSRRSSSKLRACEPPAQKCRTFRSLSTQPITKATPKKRDSKDLKLQALADAEKKVEERLLLLDVNQKTLDEQHERRRYLQQQFLQQQQQQLQEQQLQQQQLLTLVQYRGLSCEDELDPRTRFFGATNYAGGDTTTQGNATGDLRQRRSTSNQAQVEQAAGTGCRTQSANVLRSDQGYVDSSARKVGTLCALHPGIHQVFVPLNSATPALLPTSAPFAAFPSTPVTISLLPGPPPGTTPPTGLVRGRMLTPTLPSMTLQGNASSREKREKTLLAQVPRPSGKRPPYKNSKTATVFPPLPLKRSGAAAIAVTATPAAVTATAVTGGPREAPDYIKLSRTSKGAATKCLQLPPQVATTRALPPLRARSSSWTQRPQVLGSVPRDV